MALLKDVIYYILCNYPNKDELSNYRVTKMVYLSDWHFVRKYGKQMTDIQWVFDNYGPFVWDIKDTVVEQSQLFKCDHTYNCFGHEKTIFAIKDPSYQTNLTTEESASIDYVIEHTQALDNAAFTKLVYSTYPIVVTEQYHKLNLVDNAKEYNEKLKKLSQDNSKKQ